MDKKNDPNKKIMIAMSGGVDSSVAAFLSMKISGDCAGATMKLLPGFDSTDAGKVADRLGMPFHVFDCRKHFKEYVIQPFINTYKNGGTPNPCVECNRFMKFGLFFQMAETLGYGSISTGHYARVDFDYDLGRFVLRKARDLSKDQSYFLYSLTQEQLKQTHFPLGEMTKDEARRIAAEQGFENAHKKDSQDICFVPDGNYGNFIEKYTGEEFPGGDFIDTEGKVLGTHKGIIRYTVGQRKGLGLALPEPLYVCQKDIVNNRVVLSRNHDLMSRTVTANNINLIAADSITYPRKIKAKVRFNQTEQPAVVTQTKEDELKIVFDTPQRAAAPGQSVVMYDGDAVVGGGIIV